MIATQSSKQCNAFAIQDWPDAYQPSSQTGRGGGERHDAHQTSAQGGNGLLPAYSRPGWLLPSPLCAGLSPHSFPFLLDCGKPFSRDIIQYDYVRASVARILLYCTRIS